MQPKKQDVEKQDVEKVKSPDSKPESGNGMIYPGIYPRLSYDQRVFHYADESRDEEPHLMEFRLLQWLNIIGIQNDLARHEAAVQESKNISSDTMKELRTTLHEYGTSPGDGCDLVAPS
jgi:hypothetical protein